MIRLRLYRFNECTATFYYMTIHLIPNDNEIAIMYNGNSLSIYELNGLVKDSVRIEVLYEK